MIARAHKLVAETSRRAPSRNDLSTEMRRFHAGLVVGQPISGTFALQCFPPSAVLHKVNVSLFPSSLPKTMP